MTTLVCLVSKQLAPNYFAAERIRPDRILFCFTADTDQDMQLLQRALRYRGFTLFESVKIDPFDITVNHRHAQTILAGARADEEMVLNYTGGTKQMSIAFYDVWAASRKKSVYVDTQNEALWWSQNGEVIREDLKIKTTVRDYSILTNHPIGDVCDSDGILTREKLTLWLFKMRTGNRKSDVFKALEKFLEPAIHTQLKNKVWQGGRSKDLISVSLDGANAQASGIFGDVKIPASMHTKYFAGGWLEEYVYLQLQQSGYFDSVECGVEFLFPPPAGTASPQHAGTSRPQSLTMTELDVAAVRNGKIYLVECKTGDVRKADIEKVVVARDMIGGRHGIPVLAGLYFNDAALRRCRENGVAFIAGDRIASIVSLLKTEERKART